MKRVNESKQIMHFESAVSLPPTNLDIPMPPVKPPRKEMIRDGVANAYAAKERKSF